MHVNQGIATFAILAGCVAAGAQQTTQVELKIEGSNRTLSVSAEERVTADPEIAILHIGFETQPSDAKAAYAAGAKTSNEIVAAIKGAGIAEASIRSEMQSLERVWDKPHKFKLVQQWTVKTPPDRAAEILDVAITAGATDSGQIDWTVEDVRALEEKALDAAATRAKANAEVLARGMGVRLGSLVYVSNQVSGPQDREKALMNNSASFAMRQERMEPAPPLSIEPRKVSRTASVYAVFAIE